MADEKFEQAKMLIEASEASSHSFDKAILTLASGAFALSLVFLKDVAPVLNKSTLYLLKWGWSFFALCLVCILVSFQTSQIACNHLLKRIYKENVEKNKWGTITRILNWTSIVSLIAAIIFMGTFFYANLYK